MNIEIINADYNDPQHAQDLPLLLDAYSRDPMGGSEPLAAEVRDNLCRELAKRPQAFSLLCYVDGEPAGLINCFEAFSSFKCKPLINIHDVIILSQFRGLGLSQKMLSRVEEIAREKGCCKMTLEVLEGNIAAKKAYIKYGFAGYELDPMMGRALFWEKKLV